MLAFRFTRIPVHKCKLVAILSGASVVDVYISGPSQVIFSEHCEANTYTTLCILARLLRRMRVGYFGVTQVDSFDCVVVGLIV